jgi:hypothetical protein
MEKYGFVYIWYDRKHKRYYIGSHWGTENDGYICSSTWMRNAYKYRKEDFKRRIITKVTSSKADLLRKEYEYLSLIKEEELGKKYYNMTNHLNGHWFTEEEKAKTLSERISQKTKEAMQRPEVREKYLAGLATRDSGSSKPEVQQKKRESMIKTMAEKFPVENRYNPPEFNSEEYKQNMAKSVSESWKNRDKEVIGNKISESLKNKPKTGNAVKGNKWWNNGEANKRSVECPGENWIPGRIMKNSTSPKTSSKGYFWWNNGSKNTRSKESPGVEWSIGKLPHNKSYNSGKMTEIWALRKAGKLPMPKYG